MPTLIPCGAYASVSAISAWRVSVISSAASSVVSVARFGACRFGTTIRWPLLYGYLLRMTNETRPRTRTRSSRPGAEVLQKIQSSFVGPLALVTYACLQGAQRCSTGNLELRTQNLYTAIASGGTGAGPPCAGV